MMEQPPTIVLLTVDSLRADHVHGDVADTPNLDALVADGVAIEQAIAQGPFTTFSMPSLFTSKYPVQLTGIDFVEGVEGVLIEGHSTVQERLHDVGYRTAGIHSNPLLSRLFGFDRGFNHFYDSLDTVSLLGSQRLGLVLSKVKRLLRTDAYVPADEITDRACRWLDRTPDEQRFLWTHYMDVHGPYQPKGGIGYLNKIRAERLWRKAVHRPETVTATEREHLREAYVEEVEFTDRELGRLLNHLRDENLYDDALIVVTADHGDEFFEHGSYSHENKLYDELVRVPLVIKPPAGAEADLTAGETPVPLLDVAATLCEAGSAETSSFEGRSLFDRESNDDGENQADPTAENSVITEADLPPTYIGAVRTATWKYIRTPDGEELYDLRSDPEETMDRSEAEPNVVERFGVLLDDHLKSSATADSRGSIESASDIDGRLRSLGYLE